MTRKEWHIGLYTIHDCTHGCNYSLIRDKKNNKYKFTVTVPEFRDTNSKCSRHGNIENTIISVNNFDIRNPCGIFGKLHLADDIVIPHNEFTMILNFPFYTKLKITVNEPLGNGFTLKEVLYAIKLSYQDIYTMEEQSATSHTYILVRQCTHCNSININKKLKQNNRITYENLENHDNNNTFNNNGDICSICKEDIDFQHTEHQCIDNTSDLSTQCNNDSCQDDQARLIKLDACDHIFHEHCITRWVESNGKTCPLCRKSLFDCTECDGSGYKTVYYDGVVPPIEYRGTGPRLHTDGIYGIYDYYLEDLYISGLKYNSIDHELFVTIQT
jgi:hypothetical protein